MLQVPLKRAGSALAIFLNISLSLSLSLRHTHSISQICIYVYIYVSYSRTNGWTKWAEFFSGNPWVKKVLYFFTFKNLIFFQVKKIHGQSRVLQLNSMYINKYKYNYWMTMNKLNIFFKFIFLFFFIIFESNFVRLL